jgi:hypothetical protein
MPMNNDVVKDKGDEWMDAARRAGLGAALTQFPDDVRVAAEGAARAAAFARPNAPADEPWPPMKAGDLL